MAVIICSTLHVGVLVADTVVKTVDRLPGTGKLAVYDNISLYSGGCASNAAIDLAKLGAGAAIVEWSGATALAAFSNRSFKVRRRHARASRKRRSVHLRVRRHD